tara:strand:+ start:507 stop:1418 length:912 start_codon:yes stop_codon:yes gene_type:complete
MKSYEAQILEESLSLEASLETYVPGIDNPIAVLRDMNNNQEFNDDEVFFYTKDHLGSIRELVGLDGKLKQRQRYSAYGITTREKNTDEMDRLIDHAYGFTGRELDSETGLYFYRSRFYSPEMQRFVSEDTIGFGGGDTNLYRYVNGNPMKYVDPSGKFINVVIGAGVGAIFGALSSCDGNRLKGALIGGAAGALAGTGLGGIFGGALLGGATDASIQIANGSTIQNLDITSIGFSSLFGGLGTALGNLASKFLQLSPKVLGNSLKNLTDAGTKSNKIISSSVSGLASGAAGSIGPFGGSCGCK